MDIDTGGGVRLRVPTLADGKAVHALIRSCPPLDLNSSYNYFLLCSHFAETCVVGEREGEIACFLSAYRLPSRPDCLFVWQVAVSDALRGHGMAGKMLEELLSRESCEGVRLIETTVSPSNRASRRVFERFAEQRNAAWHEEIFIGREMFGAEQHEEEVLFRIGPPLNPKHQSRTKRHAYLRTA